MMHMICNKRYIIYHRFELISSRGKNSKAKRIFKYQKKIYSAIFTHIFLFMSIVLFIDLFQTHFCHFGFNRNYEQSMNLPFLIESYLSDHSIKRLCVLTIQYAAIC